MMLIHFLGEGDANKYLKVLTSTRDYDKAQKAVNDSIVSRTGSLPKNKNIKEYIEYFNSKL